jgi:hypothetical protein
VKKPFFFFGSLRDPLVLEAVLDRELGHLHFKSAVLPGYRVERAAGYSFPLLVADPNETAEGILAVGLTSEDLKRIDYFEDSEYEQRPCEVMHAGRWTAAMAYAAGKSLASSGERWDFDRFQSEDRALLVAVTRVVMREHYGVTPQDVMERIWSSICDRIAREMGLGNKP